MRAAGQTTPTDRSFPVVLFCFLLSGFAGLLFQTLWTRQFGLVFGTSELAVATVLAAYMGGLAAGAAAARRWVLRARHPLRVYGLLELGIGASALAVPSAIRASTALCVALFGGQPAPPDAASFSLSLFYLVCSFLILLVPTCFMGATLPLLARFAVRSQEQIGSRVGLLYATNTLGAVLGVLVTAFWLLPNLGLGQVLWLGVGINFAVFLLALRTALGSEPPAPVEPAARPALREGGWVLPLVFVAGVTSFGYEVLWTRLLGHVLGGSVYAFGTMLASFLLGIAGGSALATRFARSPAGASVALAVSQVGVAATSWLAFLAVDFLPALAVAVGAGGPAGFATNAMVAAAVLLPSALCIGASFPLAVRILAREDTEAGPASARVFAWNTLGAIVGAVGAGFVWIPALGYAGSLTAGACANLLVAAGALWLATPARRALASAALPVVALLLLLPPPTPWRLLSSSALDIWGGRLRTVAPEDVTYFAAGRSSTVMLHRASLGGWALLTNGLLEAAIRPRGQELQDDPAHWLGSLPVLARPQARTMLVIGLGGGTTLEAVPASVEAIDVIELEPEVLEANRSVAARRAADPLADPRVRIFLNDARGALQLTDRRYDIVVSQPSHPWTAGASHLFTREFFALVRQHLAPGGVFLQWMDTEFLDEPLLRSLVATLVEGFPQVRLYWLAEPGVTLLLASDRPLPVEQTSAAALAMLPVAFAHLGITRPEDLAIHLGLDEEGTRRFARGAEVSRDAHNLLQLRAPRAMRKPLGRDQMAALLREYDPLAAPAPGWDALRMTRRLLEQRQFERVPLLADAVHEPAQRQAILGLFHLQTGSGQRGEQELRAALRADPSLREARVALARRLRRDPLGYELLAGTAPPDPALAAVVRGWRAAKRGDWRGLEALDPELAQVAPGDALHPDAARLRARWRIEVGGAEAAREARVLLDPILPLLHWPSDAILRARASRRAGDAELALATLRGITESLTTDNPNNALLLALLDEALAEFPEQGPLGEASRDARELLQARRLAFQRAMPQYFRHGLPPASYH